MRRSDAGTRLTKNEMEIGDESCHIPSERWLIKATEWNPDRAMGRPRKRWEDINEFLKFVEEETENLTKAEQPYQQNMDQHSKRQWKMGSIRRKLHNDFRRKT